MDLSATERALLGVLGARVAQGAEGEVVWVDGRDEVAVRPDTLAVRLEEGWLHVRLWVWCAELGEAPLAVALFLGRPDEGAGPIAAGALAPDDDAQGPLSLRWGPLLLDLVWEGVLDLLEVAAPEGQAISGFAVNGRRLDVTLEAIHG